MARMIRSRGRRGPRGGPAGTSSPGEALRQRTQPAHTGRCRQASEVDPRRLGVLEAASAVQQPGDTLHRPHLSLHPVLTAGPALPLNAPVATETPPPSLLLPLPPRQSGLVG